ncbi:MAG TPA: glycosyltransferase family 4 protein [Pirellulaceae bacterium]|nr:glycosyltransferase family 4 protein [Pirellulaceae bacterium]
MTAEERARGASPFALDRPIEALVATNVPFWRLERGSHRRIEAMLRSLATFGVRWSLAYVADEPFPDDFARFGIVEARRLPHTPGRTPRGLSGLLSKHWKGTANALSVAAAKIRGSNASRAGSASKKLADFYSGEAVEALAEWMNEKRFHGALVEYVHLAYLQQANALLSPKRRPTWLIDTHDVMWQRAERHAHAGAAHWLSIDSEEESNALMPFDASLAIQPVERETLQAMLPGRRVLLAPHAVDLPTVEEESTPALPARFDASRPLSIGFIGSGGAMNFDSAKVLLEEIWPRIEAARGDAVRLVLAGEATEGYRESHRSPRILFLGRVANLGEFYSRIDVSANPVRYGAGLKIKNVEALAYGKGLVTTTVGAAGMEAGSGTAFVIDDEPARFADAIIAWSNDPASLQEFARRGRDFARKTFSPEAAYDEVLSLLREAAKRERG